MVDGDWLVCTACAIAAVAGTVNAVTAAKLKCSVVVEAANAGITPEGNQVCNVGCGAGWWWWCVPA
jgi:glutamate dehydrogenase/leucine dehydrogenase